MPSVCCSEDNYGLYATIGRTYGRHAGNIRLGAADEDVSPVAGFASLTYQFSWKRHVLGVGAARTWSAGDLAGAIPYSTQFEVYLRSELVDGLFLTPSMQYVGDSEFNASGTSEFDSVIVYALRLRYQL